MNFQMFPRFENGFLFDGLSRAATSSGLAGWLDAAAAVVGYFAIFFIVDWLVAVHNNNNNKNNKRKIVNYFER